MILVQLEFASNGEGARLPSARRIWWQADSFTSKRLNDELFTMLRINSRSQIGRRGDDEQRRSISASGTSAYSDPRDKARLRRGQIVREIEKFAGIPWKIRIRFRNTLWPRPVNIQTRLSHVSVVQQTKMYICTEHLVRGEPASRFVARKEHTRASFTTPQISREIQSSLNPLRLWIEDRVIDVFRYKACIRREETKFL